MLSLTATLTNNSSLTTEIYLDVTPLPCELVARTIRKYEILSNHFEQDIGLYTALILGKGSESFKEIDAYELKNIYNKEEIEQIKNKMLEELDNLVALHSDKLREIYEKVTENAIKLIQKNKKKRLLATQKEGVTNAIHATTQLLDSLKALKTITQDTLKNTFREEEIERVKKIEEKEKEKEKIERQIEEKEKEKEELHEKRGFFKGLMVKIVNKFNKLKEKVFSFLATKEEQSDTYKDNTHLHL
jgi:hypothetical protein